MVDQYQDEDQLQRQYTSTQNAADVTNTSILQHETTNIIYQSSMDEEDDVVMPFEDSKAKPEKIGQRAKQPSIINILQKSMGWNPETVFRKDEETKSMRRKMSPNISSRNSNSSK